MNGIYQTCCDLIATYVFGGNVVVGTYEDLITKLISTCASLFVVALPFIIVFMVIKLIIGAFNNLWG